MRGIRKCGGEKSRANRDMALTTQLGEVMQQQTRVRSGGKLANLFKNNGLVSAFTLAALLVLSACGGGGSTIVEHPGMTIDEMSFEDWQKLIDFNLSATFLFCNAIIPGMKKAGSGRILGIHDGSDYSDSFCSGLTYFF